MTQRDLLEDVLSELKHIKQHMPNGELKVIVEDVKDVKEDISELKYMLLNPEDGLVVKTNKNTEFRLSMQSNEKDFNLKMQELEDLKRWKAGVTKALWIIFSALAALVFEMLQNHK
ncbi:MAG: hypothetical protein ACO22Y_00080 [Sediminibacterium sp.]